jgi:hypothetical protein
MSCEDWATVSQRFPKHALTSAILAPVVRVVPDSCDGLAILPSLIKLTDHPAFSEDVFMEIVEWVNTCQANPTPGVVPSALWSPLLALASALIEGFSEGLPGDLQAHAADLEPPDDDLEWFCGERPPSFLRDFLAPLALCPDTSVIPPVFFQFRVLAWDGHPASHFVFFSTGVWEFLGTRLLEPTTPTLPRAHDGNNIWKTGLW